MRRPRGRPPRTTFPRWRPPPFPACARGLLGVVVEGEGRKKMASKIRVVLRPVKSIVVRFCPFESNVESTRWGGCGGSAGPGPGPGRGMLWPSGPRPAGRPCPGSPVCKPPSALPAPGEWVLYVSRQVWGLDFLPLILLIWWWGE